MDGAGPSRLPRRSNVIFFASAKEAHAAGFRPCRRCRPDIPVRTEPHLDRIVRACGLIETAERPPTLAELAEALVDGLKTRFARAEHREEDPESVRWLRRVAESIVSPRRGLDLPLDIRGTAFQRRVWEELLRILAGGTASYGEVARRIGKPGSARAVARACASNPLALAVPCHRVVRSDGDPGGYRWGIERKRVLLKREAR